MIHSIQQVVMSFPAITGDYEVSTVFALLFFFFKLALMVERGIFYQLKDQAYFMNSLITFLFIVWCNLSLTIK